MKKELKIIQGYENHFHGRENAITAQKLAGGEDCVVYGFGQSMTPILKNGQPVLVEHLRDETELSRNDIVFCKVNGHYYLHKILSVKNGVSYQIGNNHGHVNGSVGRRSIFGVVRKIF